MRKFPNADKLEADTEAAFADPQPGDAFDEFASRWVVVVGRAGDRVAWLNVWGGGREGYVGTVDEFKSMYAYESVPGYSVKLWRRGKDVTGLLTDAMAAALAGDGGTGR